MLPILFILTTTSKEPLKLGRKLFPLAGNVVAKALTETKNRMEANQIRFSWEEFGQLAQKCFEETIPSYSLSLNRPIDVECLIGVCSPTDGAKIVKLSTDTRPRFDPALLQSYRLIGGSDEAKAEFDEIYNDNMRLGGVDASPLGEGLRVIEALDSTIKACHETIGGPVQALIVLKDGIRMIRDFDIASVNDITELTVSPDELENEDNLEGTT